jgi:hypothetical protein
MLDLSSNTARMMTNVQQAFDLPRLGARNNPEAEANIALLGSAQELIGLSEWYRRRRPPKALMCQSGGVQSTT